MTSVSLGDVLSRPVAIGWAEAVAVIGELCTVLAQDGGPMPDPTDILLTSDGAVTIRSGGPGASRGTTPGRLLHTLLASSDAPSPLRLFVSVAISSDRYDSIGAFGEALAYYEASGRGPLIQAVYQRSAASIAGAIVPGAATPLPVPDLPKKASPVQSDRPKVPAWAFAAGAALLGGVGVALWFYAVTPSPHAGAATPGGESAAVDIPVAGLGAPVAERKADAAGSAAGPNSASDARQWASADGSPQGSPADGGPRVRLTDKSGFVPNAGGSPAGGRASRAAPPGGAEPFAEPIYSSASSGVRPPVPISALPSFVGNGTLDPTGIIELLINEEGRVVHVQLVSEPTRVQPMMLLSAAKTWTFRPALRDGRPVTFRMRIKVPSTLP